jgi:hypothetical protein
MAASKANLKYGQSPNSKNYLGGISRLVAAAARPFCHDYVACSPQYSHSQNGHRQPRQQIVRQERIHSIFGEHCKPSDFIPWKTVLTLQKRTVGVQFPFFVEKRGNLSLYG